MNVVTCDKCWYCVKTQNNVKLCLMAPRTVNNKTHYLDPIIARINHNDCGPKMKYFHPRQDDDVMQTILPNSDNDDYI